MKPHRQFRTSRRIGDPSSKFAYNKNLDEVVDDKNQISQRTEDEIFNILDSFIINQIVYGDGSVMSQKQKFTCIIESAKRLKTKYDL